MPTHTQPVPNRSMLPTRWKDARGRWLAFGGEYVKNTDDIVLLSHVLALALCSYCVVGAPPSESVDGPNVWTLLEPLMFPTLLAAPALAFGAFLIAVFLPGAVRTAAVGSVAALCLTAGGVTVGWGLDAEGAGLRPLMLLFVGLLVSTVTAFAGVLARRSTTAEHERPADALKGARGRR